MKGKPKSEAHKAAMGTSWKEGNVPWNKGKKTEFSAETKSWLAQKKKKYYDDHPEVREKLRQLNLGKTIPDEVKKKTSATLIGIPKTEEHKKNISLGRTGIKRKPFTEEHKRKMSESRKLHLEKKRNEAG